MIGIGADADIIELDKMELLVNCVVVISDHKRKLGDFWRTGSIGLCASREDKEEAEGRVLIAESKTTPMREVIYIFGCCCLYLLYSCLSQRFY